MPWSRASEVERVLECPGPLLLPTVDGPPGEAAAWGDGMHRLWQEDEVLPEPGYERHAPQLKERLPIVRAHREKFWPEYPDGEVERCVAVNIAEVRPVVCWEDGLNAAERDEWKARFDDDWITGALDYCHDDAILGDPLISDLKTGRSEAERGGPRERKQQWVYALATHLITGADRVVANIVLHPRYPKANPPTAIWATFAADELLAFHRELRTRRDQVDEVRELLRVSELSGYTMASFLREGDHCRWCPATAACPLVNSERWAE